MKPRGGLRPNSATIHRYKKLRKCRCRLCGHLFETIQSNARFCSANHRLKFFRIIKAIKNPKKLSVQDRRGNNFRSPFIRNRASVYSAASEKSSTISNS
jgi:hypothetical protein